ncbi:MAG: transporter substrate-binding domain-containing protein [Spirochaetaceae bacterium]
MKRYFIFFVLLNMFSVCFSQTERTYRVYNYPPHYYFENNRWQGLSIELINALLLEAGYTYKHVNLPFTRSLVQLKHGDLDIMTNLSLKEERNEYIYFIGPQMYETMSLFFPEESDYIINSLNDIKKLPGNIGIHLGYFYGNEFDKKYKTDKDFADKFTTLPNNNEFNSLVKKKRLIGYIGERYDFYYNSRVDESYRDLKEHTFVIHNNPVYFGFSKKTFTLDEINHLNEVFESDKVKNKIKVILNKYRVNNLGDQ